MIRTQHLEFAYQPDKKILDDICFQAEAGSCTAILGNNGAGKSTLLKCLNHILVPKSGTVYLNGRDLQPMRRGEIARNIAYVAQHAETARFTVYDTVLLGRKPYIKVNPTPQDYVLVESILSRMSLSSMALSYIDELSGGELQKVMLARALAQQPKVLLLDEPTSSLDLKNQYETLKLVKKMAEEEKFCVIMVIHDLNLALRYCDKFVFLKNNRVFCHGGLDCITSEVIGQVYGIPAVIRQFNDIPVVVPLPEKQ